MVAAEQHTVFLEQETRVARRVAGGQHGAQGPARQRDLLVGTEFAVGQRIGTADRRYEGGERLLDRVLGCSGAAQQFGFLRTAVVVGEHDLEVSEVGLVHRDPAAGGLPDASGEPDVVGVEVGDDHALDVGDRQAGRRQAVLQRRPRPVVVPADVDEDDAARGFHHVDLGVADGQVRHRNGNDVDAVPDITRFGHGDASRSW